MATISLANEKEHAPRKECLFLNMKGFCIYYLFIIRTFDCKCEGCGFDTYSEKWIIFLGFRSSKGKNGTFIGSPCNLYVKTIYLT